MNKRVLTIISILLGTAMLAGVGYFLSNGDDVVQTATGPEPRYRAGPFHIGIDINPETPRVGENTLTIRLSNREGNPISGAQIKAVAEMPAMGAMPAMQAPADMTEVQPGLYRGTFQPSMEGAWPLTLRIIEPELGTARVSIDLATGRKGLQLASGASHIGVATKKQETEEAPPGTVALDSRRRQLIGVETDTAQRQAMVRNIRAVGSVAYDQTRLADISLKFDAWIGELYADYVGIHVKKGEPLFTVYGPELLAAQQEYLELKRRGSAQALLAAARKRLALWDMSDGEIARLEKRDRPFDYVTFNAPASGTVVTKNIVEGSAHRAGMTLLRIADLSRVWVEADVYEEELPLMALGMPVTITLPYLPGQRFESRVDDIYPYLDRASRTGRLRVTVANPDGQLKPGMFADVELRANLGERLAVPEEAVIIAGEMRVVFEDLGDGRLAPRRVKTGQRANGYIEVLEGLDAGDCVVTSGNFLIAAESRLKAGLEQW